MDERMLPFPALIAMHELLVERFGGMRGVTEHGFGKLEAALAAPYVSVFGEDLYPDLPSQSAVLFYRLARSHGFTDGNKRVALVALLNLLAEHGLSLVATDDELYEFVIAAADHLSQDDVMAWIADRIRSS